MHLSAQLLAFIALSLSSTSASNTLSNRPSVARTTKSPSFTLNDDTAAAVGLQNGE